MSAIARNSSISDYDLLRGGSDLVDVALRAARAAAAARRVAASKPIDADDQRTLTAIAELLRASALAVQPFGPDHPHPAPPSGSLTAGVDVAIGAVLQDADPSVGVRGLSRMLNELAEKVERLLGDRNIELAQELVDTMTRLATSALDATGHIGETTSTL